MDRKGMQLVVGTAIVLILAVVVLTILFFVLKGNFKIFDSQTSSILETSEGISAKESCSIACAAGSQFAFCCNKQTVAGDEMRCDDSRLDVGCESLSCEDFVCTGDTNVVPSSSGICTGPGDCDTHISEPDCITAGCTWG